MFLLRISWWFLDMYCKFWIELARPSRFELCTNRNLSWKGSHHSLCSLLRRNGKTFGRISTFLLMILRFLKFRLSHSFYTGNVSPYLSIHSNRCNTYQYKPLQHNESCQRRQQTDSRLSVEHLLDYQTLLQSDCQNYGFPYRYSKPQDSVTDGHVRANTVPLNPSLACRQKSVLCTANIYFKQRLLQRIQFF